METKMSYKIKRLEKQLTKGLLDLVVLGFLRAKPMHGYKIITSIRQNFGVYFGPSTIYPYLNELEKNRYITSQWDLNHDRPRKMYSITPEGLDILTGSEQTFNQICNTLTRIGMDRLSFNGQQKTIDLPTNMI